MSKIYKRNLQKNLKKYTYIFAIALTISENKILIFLTIRNLVTVTEYNLLNDAIWWQCQNRQTSSFYIFYFRKGMTFAQDCNIYTQTDTYKMNKPIPICKILQIC